MRKAIAILAIVVASTSASPSSNLTFTEYNEGSTSTKFNILEDFGRYNETYTKLTGRFHYGDQKGANKTFFATYWTPGNCSTIQCEKINALIFVAHGYGEYLSNDYDELARHWTKNIGDGALVFGHDHVGHGRTTVGERALVTDMKDFTEPIIAHIKTIHLMRTGKKLPVFIAGHSMGGLISLNAILEQPELFNGFIGIGPLVKIPTTSLNLLNVLLVTFFAKIWPSFNHPSLQAMNIELLTRDESRWDAIKNDSLRYHGGVKAGMAWLMMKETEKLQKSLHRIESSILVLQGGNDQVVDPAGSRLLYQNASSIDKEYKEYPGAYHQLHCELKDVTDDVIDRTTKWMNDRMFP